MGVGPCALGLATSEGARSTAAIVESTPTTEKAKYRKERKLNWCPFPSVISHNAEGPLAGMEKEE